MYLSKRAIIAISATALSLTVAGGIFIFGSGEEGSRFSITLPGFLTNGGELISAGDEFGSDSSLHYDVHRIERIIDEERLPQEGNPFVYSQGETHYEWDTPEGRIPLSAVPELTLARDIIANSDSVNGVEYYIEVPAQSMAHQERLEANRLLVTQETERLEEIHRLGEENKLLLEEHRKILDQVHQQRELISKMNLEIAELSSQFLEFSTGDLSSEEPIPLDRIPIGFRLIEFAYDGNTPSATVALNAMQNHMDATQREIDEANRLLEAFISRADEIEEQRLANIAKTERPSSTQVQSPSAHETSEPIGYRPYEAPTSPYFPNMANSSSLDMELSLTDRLSSGEDNPFEEDEPVAQPNIPSNPFSRTE